MFIDIVYKVTDKIGEWAMYAIVRTGGKQYKVEAGDVVRVEKLQNELGSEFDLTDVLMVGGEKTFVGSPTVDSAKVTVVVTSQSKAPKVIVFKKKRRQGYRRLKGHRQLYTELFVKSITSPEGVAKTDKKAKVNDPSKKAEATKEAAPKKAAAKKAPAKKKATAKKAASKKTTAKKTTKKKATKKKAAKKTTTKK